MQLGNDFAQPRGNLRDDLPDRPGRVLGDAFEDPQRAGGAERRPAAAHDVQHAAQAEQVGTLIDHLAACLFRRHVHRRAGDDPALGHAGVVGSTRQAEIGNFDLPLDARLNQDVGRFDIAMDEPLSVGCGQTARDLEAQAQHFRDVQRPGPVELLLQGLAGDVLHDQIGQRLLLDGVNGDDILVANGGGGAGLANEALAPARWRQAALT